VTTSASERHERDRLTVPQGLSALSLDALASALLTAINLYGVAESARILIARDSDVDRVVGLEIGADDYVTKPYSVRELIARIRAVLRRCGATAVPPDSSRLVAGPIEMDVERHLVTVDDVEICLTLKEFQLLEMMLRNAGRVLTRAQLIDRVWGPRYVGDMRTLDVHIKRLRTKIERDPSAPHHLTTVRGVGYKFQS